MPSSILMRGAQTPTFLYTISTLQPPAHTNKLGSFVVVVVLCMHIHSSMFCEEEEGNSGII
jgi:hypothetical protein